MRILLVAEFFPPHRAVASLRTHSFAETWAAAGHDVNVLTTVKRADQTGLNLSTIGFRVIEVPYRVPRLLERMRASERSTREEVGVDSPGVTAKLFHPLRWLKARTGAFAGVREPDMTDFWIKPAVEWALANGPWDAVISSFGPPAAIRVGLTIKHRAQCRIWAIDFRDLWTDHHLYGGLFPITIFERYVERRALALADRLVTVSPQLASRLRKKCGKPVEVIYNGYDPASFASLSTEPAFPSDGLIRLVYTGSVFERGQDISPICAAVASEPSAILVIASEQANVWNAARERYKLGDRLDFRGSVPRPEALRMQRDASALILLDWHDPRQGVLTGKVFEYLLSPAPIWVIGGTIDSPLAQFVNEAGRGVAFGKDVERIRLAIRELAAGKGTEAQQNREMIAKLSRKEQAGRFLELLDGPKPPDVPGR
jgi:glycosyltransferase involved in cell wall biosynthesis